MAVRCAQGQKSTQYAMGGGVTLFTEHNANQFEPHRMRLTFSVGYLTSVRFAYICTMQLIETNTPFQN